MVCKREAAFPKLDGAKQLVDYKCLQNSACPDCQPGTLFRGRQTARRVPGSTIGQGRYSQSRTLHSEWVDRGLGETGKNGKRKRREKRKLMFTFRWRSRRTTFFCWLERCAGVFAPFHPTRRVCVCMFGQEGAWTWLRFRPYGVHFNDDSSARRRD